MASSDSAVLGLRDRRRAQTVEEIKDVALRQMAEVGPLALSLRAVAREVGVSVQALYHYFASRDALLTALVTDSFDALADVVAAGAGGLDRPPADRIVGAGLAYRRWAVEHPAAFQLTFGAPVPGYAAPADGGSTEAAQRMGAAFVDAVFGGWSTEELARLEVPGGSPALERQLRGAAAHGPVLPPGAYAAFTSGWAVLHGLVVLETLGHAPWLGDQGEEMLRAALLEHAGRLAVARGTAVTA